MNLKLLSLTLLLAAAIPSAHAVEDCDRKVNLNNGFTYKEISGLVTCRDRDTEMIIRKVNFKNALIILTSNIGVKEVASFGNIMGFETSNNLLNEEKRTRDIIEKALKKKFRPEFLNRIDEAIVFRGLKREDIGKIIYVEIEKLEKRVAEMGYTLKIAEEAIDFLASHGYDEEYGARPLARAIQHYVEDAVADEILNDNIKEGETITIVYDKPTDSLVVKPIKKPKKI